MNEELFYLYNPWWEGLPALEDGIPRPGVLNELRSTFASRDIVFLTGLRRVGKTTLLKLFIQELIHFKKVLPRHIFYISLDDYRLAKKNLFELIEAYRKIHKVKSSQKIYLFLDEVAFQKDFEIQLKNLYDQAGVKIYASSSSASVLKSKKPYLTGRYQVIEVLPLDFEEYLTFKKIKISKADRHLQEAYFEEYLETGGIPEYVLRGDIEYLKELVDDIIYKDIAAFHNLKNTALLKDFFLLLMERAGKSCSINKIARILAISPDTARRYLGLFEESFLIYLVPRCGKTNERLLAPKKIYAADLGVRNLFTGFRDKGSLFENYVYLKIKDHHPCTIYQEGLEIDFLVNKNTLIEVKYERKMEPKQKALFDRFKAPHKLLIQSVKDLTKLVKLDNGYSEAFKKQWKKDLKILAKDKEYQKEQLEMAEENYE